MRTLLLAIILFPIFSYAQISTPDSVAFANATQNFHKFRISNSDSTEHYLTILNQISSKYPNSAIRFSYYNLLGGWQSSKRLVNESLNSYKQALKIAQQLNDLNRVSIARFNVASKTADAGNIKESLNEYASLAELFDQNPKIGSKLRVPMYANMSMYALGLKNLQMANEYSDKILEYATTNDDSIKYYLNKMIVYEQLKKHKEKIDFGLEALKITHKTNHLSLSPIHLHLAYGYIQLDNFNQAEYHINQALKHSQILGSYNPNIDIARGELYAKKQDYDKALKIFKKVESFAKKNNDARLNEITLGNIKNVNYESNKFKEAYDSQLQSFLLTDSVYNTASKNLIKELEVKYKVKEKEAQLKQQIEVNKLQDEIINLDKQKRKNLYIFSAIQLLFVLILLYLVYKIGQDRKKIKEQNSILEKKNKEIDHKNKIREKLFFMLGHDLRSPITHLSQITKLGSIDSYSLQIDIHNIQHIYNNLLHWARLEINGIEPAFKLCNVDILIKSIIHSLHYLTNQKNITILFQSSKVQLIQTDEQILEIIIRNILINGIKYSYENSYIQIKTCVSADVYTIEIKDTGIGIPQEKLDTIFEYPESSKGTWGEVGTGMGLTLCNELLKTLNGNINIKSRPQHGTQVSLTLPLKNNVSSLMNP